MPHLASSTISAVDLTALAPLLVLLIALDVFALVRAVRDRRVPYLPRWAWVLIVLAVSPWGAIIYLVLARDLRSRTGGPAPTAPGTPTTPAVPPSSPAPASPASPGSPRVAGGAAPVAPPGRPIVVTTGLTRDYGGGAGLFGVDLRVPEGSVYGLVGPNGAGKTTLLSILTGTRRHDRGGVDVRVPRSAVAVCPDVPEFEPWLTAYEVVDLARHYVAPAAGPDAVLAALRGAGLAEEAERRVGGFSRGMTQRLGLATALVGDPRLLLLDEPTSALDPAGRAEILDLVAAMRGRRTVIFSSHILADVQRVADQVGVLRGGRLLYQGETQALIDEHLNPRWLVRLSGPTAAFADRLRAQDWVRRVEMINGDSLRVDADTMEHGELGIPRVLAAAGARLVSCEPLAADLESAFLALTAAVDAGAAAGAAGGARAAAGAADAGTAAGTVTNTGTVEEAVR